MNDRNVYATGRCTCGEIAYQLEDRPMFVHCCFCTWCQRETGSDRALNAIIETDRVTLMQGEVESDLLPTASGKGQIVSRCPACGVALWSQYLGMGEKVTFVRVGTLEDPSLTPPDICIFTENRPPWSALPGDLPVRSAFYRLREHWPEESMTRLKALQQ